MKKKIALLLLLTLAMTVILAACRQTEATKIIPRWDERNVESYEYTITLADFDLTSDGKVNSPHFKSYGTDSASYYKDFDVRVGEPFDSQDEVRPTSVSGKFTLTISHPEDGYDLLETKQEMEVTYDDKEGKLIDESVMAMLVAKQLVVSNNGGSITLKSTVETTVQFKHNESQAPQKSGAKVTGFYVGKAHQEVSIYEISTEYTYEDRNTNAATTLTQMNEKGEMETTNYEKRLKRYTEGSFIDSNQVFTYARSLDKSSSSFQDNPSVTVYNPLTQLTQTTTFSFSPSVNAILTDGLRGAQGEELYVKLPALGVVIDGMAFMSQECVPTLQEKLPDLFDAQGKGPDVTFYAIDPYAKHTPLRFRVGYVSYELTHYDDALWNALIALAASDK